MAVGRETKGRHGGVSTRLAIGLVAAAVCGYFAWVQIDCALDAHCHLNWCGKHPCGLSHDK